MKFGKTLMQVFEEESMKTFWMDFGAYKVYKVDGEKVRRQEIEFCLGGNPCRYPKLVPDGELWVEDTGNERDMIATVFHELVETVNMKYEKMSYDDAHVIASRNEKILRKIVSKK